MIKSWPRQKDNSRSILRRETAKCDRKYDSRIKIFWLIQQKNKLIDWEDKVGINWVNRKDTVSETIVETLVDQDYRKYILPLTTE